MGAGVTYEGEIEPSETGLFRFILYYAGYTKVYINNELAVPNVGARPGIPTAISLR